MLFLSLAWVMIFVLQKKTIPEYIGYWKFEEWKKKFNLNEYQTKSNKVHLGMNLVIPNFFLVVFNYYYYYYFTNNNRNSNNQPYIQVKKWSRKRDKNFCFFWKKKSYFGQHYFGFSIFKSTFRIEFWNFPCFFHFFSFLLL